MPTPRKPVPFANPFTLTDVRNAALTRDDLRGWIARGDVVVIGRGTYATPSANLGRERLIHINREITDGRQPVTYEAAALLHNVCMPPALRPRHKVPQRLRDLPPQYVERHAQLLVPSRELTVLELARWQRLPGALVSFECWRRARPHRDAQRAMQQLLRERAAWPGMGNVERAHNDATGLCGSPLESYSLGLMRLAGVPSPELQARFDVDGYRYYVDFFWPDQGLIGEADGATKYDAAGRAQFEERRRQARLQSLGFDVMRWGWPEVYPNPTRFVQMLRQRLSR